MANAVRVNTPSGWQDIALVGPMGTPGATGATGATGPAGITWRGAWSAGTAYAVGDGVSYLGSSYRRLVAGTTAGTPAGDTANWVLLAAKGDTGATGTTGATGATGATGPAGLTVRSGSGAPSGGLGIDGDYYIDSAIHSIYGPKTSGVWGSPTSLVGPAGAPGDGARILWVSEAHNGLTVSGTSLPITPTGIQAGDLMLAFVANGTFNTVANTPVAPAGWNSIAAISVSDGTNFRRYAAFWKLAGAADAGSPTFTFTFGGNSSLHLGAIVTFRNAIGIDASATDTQTVSVASVNAPSVTTTKANGALVVAPYFLFDPSLSMTFPTSMNERVDYSAGASGRGTIGVATQTLGAAGATGTRTVTPSAADYYGVMSVALIPAMLA